MKINILTNNYDLHQIKAYKTFEWKSILFCVTNWIVPYSLKFTISDRSFVVSEFSTGMSVGSGSFKTPEQAVDNAIYLLNRHGFLYIKKLLKKYPVLN